MTSYGELCDKLIETVDPTGLNKVNTDFDEPCRISSWPSENPDELVPLRSVRWATTLARSTATDWFRLRMEPRSLSPDLPSPHPL